MALEATTRRLPEVEAKVPRDWNTDPPVVVPVGASFSFTDTVPTRVAPSYTLKATLFDRLACGNQVTATS